MIFNNISFVKETFVLPLSELPLSEGEDDLDLFELLDDTPESISLVRFI